ncbi:histidine phosphatase family protein [Lacticaseibacillus daqingensis]|uniref:histidine phosphatase family protein n=1 Tax=Lacticaseibacillus daqingensis TaxID=2486014 RepID=UPI001784BC18|nr:histidine phosphatase family protein [Lacticaseibacillus daqingensis]
MTQTLYLMRHGETLFNVLHRIQGWCDSPLTPAGIVQGQAARAWFDAQGVTFDAAFCSTAERAADTLELVCDQPYTRVKGLRECGFGRFEGQAEYLNPTPPYGDFFVPYGGEADATIDARVGGTVAELMASASGQAVLMVSHAGAIHHFIRLWANAAVTLPGGRLPNCAIVQYAYDAGQFTLQQVIDPLHPRG